MVHLSWESYIFEEVSYGYIPIPIWIPQVPVALGMIMFTIAILDDLWCLLSANTASYLVHESKELQIESEPLSTESTILSEDKKENK